MINFTHKLLAIALIAGAALSLNASQRALTNPETLFSWKNERALGAATVLAACQMRANKKTRDVGKSVGGHEYLACLSGGRNLVVPNQLKAYDIQAVPVITRMHLDLGQ